MNDILSEYFTLNSSKSVDKGNGVAIFCAIVSIVACSYSLNLASNQNHQLTRTIPKIEAGEKAATAPVQKGSTAQPASHQE